MRRGTALAAAPARGFTLLEAMVGLGLLVVGLVGLAALQLVAVRANHFGTKMSHASALARDLAENVQRWDYDDPRLAIVETVDSTDHPRIRERWELGRADTVLARARPQFGEVASDANATTPGALGAGYQGLSPDVDRDGQPDFHRYWSVWGIDLANTGTVQGKLVQIVVRWRDASAGHRQVTLGTFLANPQAGLE
jgi:type II secretory pathway pseudopilin PulG